MTMVMASSIVRAMVRAVSKRKIRATRAALTLTPSAVQKINQLLKDKPEHVGVKVGVRIRGCNGLSYTLEYTKSKGDSDEEVVQDGEFLMQHILMGSERDVIQIRIGLPNWFCIHCQKFVADTQGVTSQDRMTAICKEKNTQTLRG
uniref:FeS cluster biogenesis domain-containing protein n=1 Tax=Accipiter nisus TaxID=211598 RepID=A0A8B9MXD0_9AVES